MKTKIVARNTLFGLLYQIVASIFGFITPALIINTYGSEMNGLTTSINQLLGYLMLMEAGISGAAVYEMYRYLQARDYDTISRIVSSCAKYYNKIGIILLFMTFLIGPIYSFYIVKSRIDSFEILQLFIVFGVNASVQFFVMARSRIILTADQKNYVISIVNLLFTIISQIIAIYLILQKEPVILIYTSSLILNIIKGIVFNELVNRIYSNQIKFKSIEKYPLPSQKYNFIHEIFYNANSFLPIIVINLFYNLEIASVYAIYTMPITILNYILSSYYHSVSSTYGNMVALGDINHENKYYKRFGNIFFVLTSILLGTSILFIDGFVIYYTRNSNYDYYYNQVGLFIIFFALSNSLRVVYSIPTISHGLFKETSFGLVLFSIVSLVFSLSLGYFKPEYVTIGPIVAYISNAIYQKIKQKKYIKNFSNKSPLKGFTASLITLVFITIISQFTVFRINSIFEFFVNGLLSLVITLSICTIVFYTFYFKETNIFLKSLARKGV